MTPLSGQMRHFLSLLRDGLNLVMALLACGLITLGISLMLLYGQSLWAGWQSRSWQAVPAVIVDTGLRQGMSPRSGQILWEADIRYAYAIAGRHYESQRVSFNREKTLDRAWLETRLQQEWQAGTTLTAWVKPGHPQEAVLHTGVSPWLAGFVACGLVLLITGLGFLRMLWQDAKAAEIAATTSRLPRKKIKSKTEKEPLT